MDFCETHEDHCSQYSPEPVLKINDTDVEELRRTRTLQPNIQATPGAEIHRITQTFKTATMEKAYLEFSAISIHKRVTRAAQVMAVLSLVNLLRAYFRHAHYDELVCMHVVNLSALSAWAVFYFISSTNGTMTFIDIDNAAALFQTSGFVTAVFTIKLGYDKFLGDCETPTLDMACKVGIELNRGLLIGTIYAVFLLVSATTLRRFSHFVCTVGVLDAAFGIAFFWLQPLGEAAPTFAILMLCLTVLMGGLNRSLDMMMRREFLWHLQLIRSSRHNIACLERSTRQRAKVVAYLFHEIRNPVNIITLASAAAQSSAESLSIDHATPGADAVMDIRELLQTVTASAATAGSVLTDALDLERLSAGSFVFVPTPFKAEDIWLPVVQSMKLSMRKKNQKLELDVDPQLLSLVVEGDVQRLQQVVSNFLSNAIKFSPENSLIQLTAHSTDSGVAITSPRPAHDAAAGKIVGRAPIRVTVSDLGPGVPPEEQATLFQPFTQIRAGSLQGGGGTGLGLSLSKEFVQKGHDGTIGMVSPGSLGAGSTFYFQIVFPIVSMDGVVPVESQCLGRAITATEHICGSKRAVNGPSETVPLMSVRSSRSTMRTNSAKGNMFGAPRAVFATVAKSNGVVAQGAGKGLGEYEREQKAEGEFKVAGPVTYTADVLLVDDSMMTRKLMARLLTSLELSCETAENGKVAVAKVAGGERYRLILMDKEMPIMDGYEATRAIRELDPAVPVVGVTGNGLPEQQLLFRQHGATEILVKPVSKAAVRDVCVRHNLLTETLENSS